MKEKDIFDELIEVGKKRGQLTYDEINEALPSEFFTPDEIEDLMDLLSDMGVRIVDADEAAPKDEEKTPEYEKTEDLVQAYFHSMGDISILTKDEEVELAKKLEEGKEIIAEIIRPIGITVRIREHYESEDAMVDMVEEEKVSLVMETTLEQLEVMVRDARELNEELSSYGGTVKSLRALIKNEKSKKRIRPLTSPFSS